MSNYVAESERIWLQPLEIETHLEDVHLMLSNPRAMEWSWVPSKVLAYGNLLISKLQNEKTI